MRVWTLKFRAVDLINLKEVKDGSKAVETRAATPKYKDVKAGDILRFVCGKRAVQKKIVRSRHFSSIGAMLKVIPYKKIMPSKRSVKEVYAAYYSYPGYKEKIRRYGVFAFHLK